MYTKRALGKEHEVIQVKRFILNRKPQSLRKQPSKKSVTCNFVYFVKNN